MKSICKKIAGAALVLLLVCVMTGCPHDSSDTPPVPQTPPVNPTPPAEPPAPIPMPLVEINGGTVRESIGADGGPFKNASEQSVTVDTFYMAETELTYAKWYEVYPWATSAERGIAKYTFANMGCEGSGGTNGAVPTAGNTEPVTCVNCRDAVVWCNAASEKNGLTPVYRLEETTQFTDTTKVLRFAEDSSVASGEGKAEKAVINESANGYRLPTEAEWEYAARGGNPTVEAWTYMYAGTNDEGNLCDYAVYDADNTANVRSKKKNTSGLYDMSGNVWEWCYDKSAFVHYVGRGGCSGNYASDCVVARRGDCEPYDQFCALGFRVVRNAN